MFPASFKEAQMGVGLGIRGMNLQDGAPCGLGLGIVALLFQRKRRLALIFPSR